MLESIDAVVEMTVNVEFAEDGRDFKLRRAVERWALVAALHSRGVSTLTVPGGQLLVFVALAALAGVVAAVLPARRAARLDVLHAISHD